MSGCCFEKKMTEPFGTVAELSVVLAVVHLCQVQVPTGLCCLGWGSSFQSWRMGMLFGMACAFSYAGNRASLRRKV